MIDSGITPHPASPTRGAGNSHNSFDIFSLTLDGGAMGWG